MRLTAPVNLLGILVGRDTAFCSDNYLIYVSLRRDAVFAVILLDLVSRIDSVLVVLHGNPILIANRIERFEVAGTLSTATLHPGLVHWVLFSVIDGVDQAHLTRCVLARDQSLPSNSDINAFRFQCLTRF